YLAPFVSVAVRLRRAQIEDATFITQPNLFTSIHIHCCRQAQTQTQTQTRTYTHTHTHTHTHIHNCNSFYILREESEFGRVTSYISQTQPLRTHFPKHAVRSE